MSPDNFKGIIELGNLYFKCIIFECKNDNGTEITAYSPFTAPAYVLLPPNSHILMEVEMSASSPVSVIFVGEVYN